MLASRKHHSFGFTLLELLIVISLLSMLAAVGARAYRERNNTPYFEAIIKILERARFMAISEGHRVDLPCHEIASAVQAGLANKSFMNCTSTLPPFRDNTTISFFSDGSSSGGLITLKNSGQNNTIKIDWLTGKIDQS